MEPKTEPNKRQIGIDLERGQKLLSTASLVPRIRSLLEARGYTIEEHLDGWRMHLYLTGLNQPWADTTTPFLIMEAMDALDQWDNLHFGLAHAALDLRYPSQSAYLFENIAAKEGSRSLEGVHAFVERYRSLKDGTDPNREESRVADGEAMALLERRGIIDGIIEERLRGLIEEATSLAPPLRDFQEEAAYKEMARLYHIWLEDWRATARLCVTKRRDLIRLGLAKTRRRKTPAPAKSGSSGAGAPSTPNGAGGPGVADGGSSSSNSSCGAA